MLGSIFSSSQSTLSPQKTLDLASSYLDTARKTKDLEIALVLCDNAEASLSQMKRAVRKAHAPETLADQTLRDKIATVYFEHGKVLAQLGQHDIAQASYKKAQKWGYERAKSAATMPVMSLFTNSAPAVIQTATSTSMSAQAKSDLVDYLFEKALLTLSSLEVSNKPSLFLVYAHDNPKQGQAKADIARYLIDKLSTIYVDLYSDQTPLAQPYSFKGTQEDGQFEDILTSQLCLLPDQLIDGVAPVDKVVVCCSEVLGNYLKEWPDYKNFQQALQEAYSKDKAAYRTNSSQARAFSIRGVVRAFSQGQVSFHHVLTEIAFLQIREEHRKDQHGIISVPLTPKSHASCLAHFISETAVRIGDIPRFEVQAQAGRMVYTNQSRHWVLFKLIERVLVDSDEARTFLNKFWQGYSDCLSRLQSTSARLDGLELAKLVDSIFDGIRTALHSQLAFTVQQQHQQLRFLHADPKLALKGQYFAVLKQDKVFQETLQLYVEPRGKVGLNSQRAFPLLATVEAFLQSDKQVLLLTGDSGAGKSTFNRMLEMRLWESKKANDLLPLFISLPSIDKPEHDLITKALRKRGLSAFQIQKLKKEKQKFIFILDGYDEIRQTQNLYLSNQINQPDNWLGQMIISCRTEYLGQHYQSRFQPNPHLQEKDASFEEITLEPFSKEECTSYLSKYVNHNSTGWTVQQYREALEQPHIQDLVSNPFLLRVVLEALPYLENEGKTRSAIQLRLDLYDQFVRQWFERNEQRLSAQNLTEEKRERFRVLCDEGFAEYGIALAQDLAVHLYREQEGNPLVEYSAHKNKGSWKEAFFGRAEEKQLLREAWPLTRSDNQYRFIHKSLLEYFVARALFDSFDACTAAGSRSRRGSNTSVYSFDHTPVLSRPAQPALPLAPKHWFNDLGVTRLLTERVVQEPAFKQQLLSIIERSKTDRAVRQAAANAITILVRAGVQFNGADLKGIQIPGADLSYGVFDAVQLQGSDLRKVNLRNSWLRQANLSEAKMDGVQFGELPSLQLESPVHAFCYSPDGRYLVIATGERNEPGKLVLYEVETLTHVHTFEGHTFGVISVAFSNDSQTLASGSQDRTIRLWSVAEKEPLHMFAGHIHFVTSVAFSSDGQTLASSSVDGTVRLWSIAEKKPLRTFKGRTSALHSVAFSSDGQTLALGRGDGTVRLWSRIEKKPLHTFEGHTRTVKSVAFSSDGQTLASGSEDVTVRLWSVAEKKPLHTFEGHTGVVNSIAFSSDGQTLASCSFDKTVRLWSVAEKKPLHTLEGHTGWVSNVAFSSDGQTLASAGILGNEVRLWSVGDKKSLRTFEGHIRYGQRVACSGDGQILAFGSDGNTVQLWSVAGKRPLHTFEGHKGEVTKVAFSSDGQMLVSGSRDGTVGLWSVAEKRLLHMFEGHADHVFSVAFSSDGQILASSSSDNTVRLWSVTTKKPWHPFKLDPFNGFFSMALSVAFSSDGQTLAFGGTDRTVQLWSVAEKKPLHRFEAHTNSVKSVAFSSDGQTLASGSADNTVRLWSVAEKKPLRTLKGHTGDVASVAFSSDGQMLASGSWDKTVRLWSMTSGQCLTVIQGFNEAVYSVAWYTSAEGVWLATGGGDEMIRFWQVHRDGEACRVTLHWASAQTTLTTPEVSIQDVIGLSARNTQLLKQRGATGEPRQITRSAL